MTDNCRKKNWGGYVTFISV